MDSRLAADPVARHILEILATLEKAAGVRAHYRILDPPPLTSTEQSSLQTVARVLGDWIGLRNAMFDLTIVEHDQAPRLVRLDPDHEEFAMEIPVSALARPETALAAVTRQVARAYLITSNIAGSSVEPVRTAGSLADVTAIFLGMGKLVLNAPASGGITLPDNVPLTTENQPLSPEYLAFTHRLVCSMRGLDWAQHTSGMSTQAINLLRTWDPYRDSVFSQSLRNVLTASASHRPLMDAVEDNHLALARFDQLQRALKATVLVPLQQELETYHLTCREGMERLNAREQDTYDPCLLYLNQLRRRMDLQRYADMLLVQQDYIVNRLRVLTAGLSDLQARELVNLEVAGKYMEITHCPFDGTPITPAETSHDSRVKCPTCGYAFVATSGLPQITAMRPSQGHQPETGSLTSSREVESTGSTSKSTGNQQQTPEGATTIPAKKKRSNKGAGVLIWGIILLPLSWLPLLSYVLLMILQGKESPLAPLLGKIGIWGSGAGILLVIIGIILLTSKWLEKKKHVAAAEA
jgi:uncharacterized Zn finger protein (UPF0148 family)